MLKRRGASYDIHSTPEHVYIAIDENEDKTGYDEACVYLTFWVNGKLEIMAADGHGPDGEAEIEVFDYDQEEDCWWPRFMELLKWLGY